MTPHPIDIYVGQRLKYRRNAMGLSQSELAEAVGITFQQVQKYERGANRMGASRLYELAKILQVSVSYFFDGYEKKAAANPSPNGMDEESAAFEHEPAGGREAMELMRSFQRVQNPKIRKSVLTLVRNMADGKPTLDDE
jgi:transcriptional regulator with XRE-family HTH domain